MRMGLMRLARPAAAVTAVAGACLLGAAAALAGPSGAVFTTVNESTDGPGHCHNGSPAVNCNQYYGKQYVWLSGGPSSAHLGDGTYFFAVVEPGGKSQANDGGGSKNLSDDYDAYTNRTFTISGGTISYSGTHSFDHNLIRLAPYADTTNPGGEYQLVVCSLASGYPSSDCIKSDNFKVAAETTPPLCKLFSTGTSSGRKYIQIDVQDSGSGLASIVASSSNADTPISFTAGTTDPVIVTATKLIQSKGAHVALTVKDGAGNTTVCDPVLPAVRGARG